MVLHVAASFRNRGWPAFAGILACLAGVLSAAQLAEASGRKVLPSPNPLVRVSQVKPLATRSAAPVIVATGTADGQAGFVHFFVIRDSNGESETQVGIELEDQRIAWSFPGLGVVVSPFFASGILDAQGKQYEVQHLYGMRPFPDDASMHRLQKELPQRVARYIDDETPYCYSRAREDAFCLSCLDFAVRMLFPGYLQQAPALPSDLKRSTAGVSYTTEDLLLYFLGLQGLSTQSARLDRIAKLALPENLREDASRLVESIADEPGASRAAKPRRAAEPSGNSGQQRSARRPRS